MALIQCPQCGKQISDKAIQCPNCGADVKAEPIGQITFEWKGKWVAVDTDVYLSINGKGVGDSKHYSFKKGFRVDAPLFKEESKLRIKAEVIIDDISLCRFEKGKNYICKLSHSRIMGGITYKISEEGGKVIFKKGYSTGRKVLCALGAAFLIFAIYYYAQLGLDYFKNDNQTISIYANQDESTSINKSDENISLANLTALG